MKKKITIQDFKVWKAERKMLNMLNCYDYMTATLYDRTDIPILLVGDSLGMCILGYSGTTPVTMEEMILHIKAVVKGAPSCFIVGDMPFGSYNVSCEQAIMNATRLMKEGGCDAIKLEGGVEMADKIAAIVKAGIPVMGHLGLTPQTASALGGFRVQGKSLESARKMIADIKAVEAAGAFCTLIECAPNQVTEAMMRASSLPVIGLGAGPNCDGYGSGYQDMFGLSGMCPKFVKPSINLGDLFVEYMNKFHKECEDGTYPGPEQCYASKIDLDIDALLKEFE